MPYTYTYPHDPSRWPNRSTRWVILTWAVLAAAGIAVVSVGAPFGPAMVRAR